jgi:phosphoribosylamine--glycine ligase
MKVLVIGSGGREHALAWKLAQSARVTEVLVAPGNAGTAHETKCRNVDVAAADIDGLIALVRREGVTTTIVGPEGPLVAGVVDRFRAEGLRIFGPTAAAAQLEGSKAFAKDFLARHRIPTGHYAVHTDVDAALAHVRATGAPIVVKADGLAAGKGVIVAMTLDEAEAAITDMLAGNAFGSAGARVVIEEFLDGEEASFISMVDATTALPMATSQDHKRVGDGDTGPNTGGMGAYTPVPWLPSGTVDEILDLVLQPVVDELATRGTPFVGLLYAGLAITAEGPSVVEFNCRFGDPETQSVLALLDTPLGELLLKAATGALAGTELQWRSGASVTVVIAAENYPATSASGDEITVGDLPQGVHLLHAGTSDVDGRLVSAGGRVLSVTSVGLSLADARERAYAGVEQVSMRGGFSRSDIAARAVRGEISVPVRRSEP